MSTAPINSAWSLSMSSQTPNASELLLLPFLLTAREGGLCGASIAAGKKLESRLLSVRSALWCAQAASPASLAPLKTAQTGPVLSRR